MSEEFTKLPDNLPIPENDGTASHLLGRQIPDIILPSTKDNFFDLSNIDRQYGILYFFPMMKMPGKDLPLGWNDIPGARGCTPQNISFSENNTMLEKFGAISIGISSQSIYDLEQLSSMRKLSQILVSDNKLEFQKRLNVPTFDVDGKIMYKRVTLIVKNSKIIKVFYPIFPPDRHIFKILEWLENNSAKN
jgi:peroxiredoxin